MSSANVYHFSTGPQQLVLFSQANEGRKVAKSNEEHLDEAVLAVVDAAKRATKGKVTRITVDIASAAEYPYRLDEQDEQWGLVGLARPPS